jgi:DNA-directed RNA polymerase specialized sigma24 family protein
VSKRSARGRGAGAAHLNGADLARLRELVEGARTSGRELAEQGLTPREIAELIELPEGAVRDLLSEATEVSPATIQALARRNATRRSVPRA